MLLCHGDADPVVPHRWGQESASILKKLNKCVDFRTYKGMSHSSSDKVTKYIFVSQFFHSLIHLYYRKWKISRHLLNKLCHKNRERNTTSRYIVQARMDSHRRIVLVGCKCLWSLFYYDLLEPSAIWLMSVSLDIPSFLSSSMNTILLLSCYIIA